MKKRLVAALSALLMIAGLGVAITVLASPASAYLGPPIAVQPNHDYPAPMDYNGDGNLDPTVVRLTSPPTRGQLQWYVYPLGPNQPIDFGLPGDVPVPGNYFKYGGDEYTDDIAVWRPSNGVWYIRAFNGTQFVTLTIQWGLNGDYPLPIQTGTSRDNTHDVTLTVFRPNNSTYYVYPNGAGQKFQGSSAPATGGYTLNEYSQTKSVCEIDPTADLRGCLNQAAQSPEFSQPAADKVYQNNTQYSYGIAGDYGFTYDWGLTDFPKSCSGIGFDQITSSATSISVIRNNAGTLSWYIRNPGNGVTSVNSTIYYGLPTDIPVPGHYYGGFQQVNSSANPVYHGSCDLAYNPQTNVAVWRPTDGTWYIRDNSGISHHVQWGLPW